MVRKMCEPCLTHSQIHDDEEELVPLYVMFMQLSCRMQMYIDVVSMQSQAPSLLVKFIYSEKATQFCENFTLLLATVHTVKRKVKISQNFLAFSEYLKFTWCYFVRLVQQLLYVYRGVSLQKICNTMTSVTLILATKISPQ